MLYLVTIKNHLLTAANRYSIQQYSKSTIQGTYFNIRYPEVHQSHCNKITPELQYLIIFFKLMCSGVDLIQLYVITDQKKNKLAGLWKESFEHTELVKAGTCQLRVLLHFFPSPLTNTDLEAMKGRSSQVLKFISLLTPNYFSGVAMLQLSS